MEAAASIFKFWGNSDVTPQVDDVRNVAYVTDDYDSDDDDDSLFDLNLSSDSKTDDYPYVESPRDVFLTKIPFSISKSSSPITILRSTPKLKLFFRAFKKPAKTESGPELKASLPKTGPVLTRDNSLRSKLLLKDHEDDDDVVTSVVPKYMKMIKPFYSRSSPKVKDLVTPIGSPVNLSPRRFSEGSRTNSFKNLGKSRSSQPPVIRRDDLMLDNAIEGAILHCKRSMNACSSPGSLLLHPSS